MAQMPQLRTIANKTPADAVDPEYNFETIENHVDNELINRDGSVAMQAPLVLPAPPVNDNQAATKGYVDSLIFPGVMVEYGGDTSPSGWAFCDGSPQSSTDPIFAPLFAVIGYKFGDAGGGNFNLPDFRKRVAVGRDVAVPEYDTVGITGGSAAGVSAHIHAFNATHSHTSPVHNHDMTDHTHAMTHTHSINPPNTSTTSDNHRHDSGSNSSIQRFDSGTGTYSTPGPAGSSIYTGYDSHSHSVNIGSFTSGGSSSSQTGDGSASLVNTGNKAATVNSTTIEEDTESTGEAGAGNYPPYVVVTKIVKL